MKRSPALMSTATLGRGALVPLVGLLSIALCFGVELPVARAEVVVPVGLPAAGAADASDSDGDGSPDRGDVIAASVSARLSGVAVEDLSQRSGSVRVWVNPDGTLTQESHASPVWVQSDDGRWVDVDYTLVQGAGSAWVPRAAPTAVVIAGGGGREFARMELPGGGSTVWSWPAELPAPVVEGASATYSVSDGVEKVARKSDKEASADAPRGFKGERVRPGESLEEAVKRIMGRDYPTSKKDRGPQSIYSQGKKYLNRRR